MGTVKPVKMFVFAGRKHNLEIQLPYIKRILANNPNVSFDVWNLTRNNEDDIYVRSISGDRITVMNQFARMEPHLGWNRIYDYYADTRYRDCWFVKLDDDVLFIDTRRFNEFLALAQTDHTIITSAHVINNGACTEYTPHLQTWLNTSQIPLLDVHQHATYGMTCHEWFNTNWQTAITQPLQIVPCNSWLSINFIAYSYHMGRQIAAQVGRKSPPHIEGRQFSPRTKLGDEGMVNMLPRQIVKNYYVGHATFGPQQYTTEQLENIHNIYTKLATHYLGDM